MISYGSDNNSVSVVVSKDMGEKAQAILMDNFAGQDFMKETSLRASAKLIVP